MQMLLSVTIVWPAIAMKIVFMETVKVRKAVSLWIKVDIAISVQGNAHISLIRPLMMLEDHGQKK